MFEPNIYIMIVILLCAKYKQMFLHIPTSYKG